MQAKVTLYVSIAVSLASFNSDTVAASRDAVVRKRVIVGVDGDSPIRIHSDENTHGLFTVLQLADSEFGRRRFQTAIDVLESSLGKVPEISPGTEEASENELLLAYVADARYLLFEAYFHLGMEARAVGELDRCSKALYFRFTELAPYDRRLLTLNHFVQRTIHRMENYGWMSDFDYELYLKLIKRMHNQSSQVTR